MELNEIDGFDGDRNPTTFQLPVLRVVKQALLALDYSQGGKQEEMAANQLVDQWVRDAVFQEDASTVRTDVIPEVMAAMRNTAISVLRFT